MTSAAERWAAQLDEWAIPEDILRQAPEPPWSFPVAVFRAAARPQEPDSPSRLAARDALPAGGSVLDVGCGGGSAALAVVPPAGRVTGVDTSPDLLAAFAADAGAAGAAHVEVTGAWPAVAPEVEPADVVVCHHVVYNVTAIEPFLTALTGHARRRVVVELTARHPLWANAPLWRRFWDLERPAGPTADDFLAVLADLGIVPRTARWSRPVRRDRADPGFTAMARRQLCLPAERDEEVAAALAELPDAPVGVVAAWWDPT